MIDFAKFMNTPDTGEEGSGATDTEPDVPTNNCPVCNKPIDECTCGCCKPTPPDCNCGCTPTPPCKPCPELPRRGTPFYHLPQWGPADLCDWFVKMNISMMTIDSALHNMDLKIMRQPGELECRIKQLRADLQDLSDIVTCQGSSLIELKDRMDAVETSTNALQETINNQQLQISNLDTRVTTSELNVAAMQTRVANLDANFSKVTSEFALLKQDFATLNLTVKTIEDAQAAVDTRLTTVEDELEAEVQRSTTKDEELKTEIDALKQVDDDLIEKDRTLEAKNLEQDGRIQNNSSRIDTLSNGLNSAQDAIVITQSDIVDLQREDTAIKGRLDSVETDITNLQDKDGVLEQSIAQNTTNITTLTSTVQNLVTTEEGHDTRLNNLESRTNANEIELESQDSRIHALEESDMAQGEKITTLEQNDATVAETLETINDTVASHTTQIGKIREDLQLTSEKADNNENAITSMQPEVAELDARVTALEEGGGSEGGRVFKNIKDIILSGLSEIESAVFYATSCYVNGASQNSSPVTGALTLVKYADGIIVKGASNSTTSASINFGTFNFKNGINHVEIGFNLSGLGLTGGKGYCFLFNTRLAIGGIEYRPLATAIVRDNALKINMEFFTSNEVNAALTLRIDSGDLIITSH